jgi:hypothetical protein
MTVRNYLDCGCAIMVDGRREWCPTCLSGARVSNFKEKPKIFARAIQITLLPSGLYGTTLFEIDDENGEQRTIVHMQSERPMQRDEIELVLKHGAIPTVKK